MQYQEFIASKAIKLVISGFDVEESALNPNLFDFQRVIVKWALKRGRAAIFADTGLGKTLMQTSWADEVAKQTGGDVLIFAPLCVARQTVDEGKKFGIKINYCRDQSGIKAGINITNYEMMDRFDLSLFSGVVMDESSIIKNRDGKTRNAIIESCSEVPYRLSCTATPSPNDFMELGNQAEFLGLMAMTEMLATYFIHDGGETSKWILKGHGKTKFWEWMSTWSVCIRNPSDLGFDGSKYILPPINIIPHVVESKTTFGLFADVAQGLLERNQARRDSVDDRVAKCFSVIHSDIYGKIPSLTQSENNDGAQRNNKFRVHEGISSEKYGEVEENSRAAGDCKCKEKGEICERCGIQSIGTCKGEGISKQESTAEKSAENKVCIRTDAGPIQSNAGICESQMPDMRILGQNAQNKIPSSGSLPCDKQDSRNIVHELQSSTREIQGQHRTIEKGYSLSGKPFWFIWCHLNSEQELLEKAFGEDCFSVYGSLSLDEKERRIRAWMDGERPIMISKPSVLASGMNFQHCHNTAFVGLSDSWEQYYQAIRRFYRFGQDKIVNVHVISAESEGSVVENIKRKDEQNKIMGEMMIGHMKEMMQKEIFGTVRERNEYVRDVVKTPDYEVHLVDCVELASEIETGSIDYTIFSPPFASLYTYSNSDRDMGNCRNHSEFYQQFRYLVDEMFRITRPGRLLSFHCMNLPTSKQNDGFIGIRDFRGELIRMFVDAGWIYHSEVCIWKDPVTAMQRTKALGLLHKTIRKDSSMSRQGIADYLVTMRKPGENDKPVRHYRDDAELQEVCTDEGLNPVDEEVNILPVQLWQKYASPVWMDINPSRTLNFRDGRDEDDERHICPLQLDVIERAMHLWTAPNDLVFSPFTGIGSEGYTAVKMGRRFIGSELKRSYWELAKKNIADAKVQTMDLFSQLESV